VSSVTSLVCVLLLAVCFLLLFSHHPTMDTKDNKITTSGEGTTVTELPSWTTPEQKSVRRFSLKNPSGMEVRVMSWGATVTNIILADGTDVTLGYDDIQGYLNKDNPYIGAVVGRVANRIAKATFTLNNKTYSLDANNGENMLHGGYKGFDKINWSSSIDNDCVVFSLHSPDGDGGFPGHVVASVTYILTATGMLLLRMTGVSSMATPINLASHAYFNLAGHAAGAVGLYQHTVRIPADMYTPVDNGLIPTGELAKVDGTPFDLRVAKTVGDVINLVNGETDNPGYDHNMVVGGEEGEDEMKWVAEVRHPQSGKVLRVFSNQPGIQFYTGNFLPKEGLAGKNGSTISFHGGICLETQKFPDFVNKPQFPKGILKPGQIYRHNVGYQFGNGV